ncbi:MAG TPA: cellulase family glycosylhydrolase [Patescibacteria group bacterium]|nr:cellulase family glycosylhydrolase [Patescibacteria group bacterium]
MTASQAASKHELPKINLAAKHVGFQSQGGKAFYPFGVTYYRPGTGWAPQVWKQWDAEATRRDFIRMKELRVNCVRVFLSYGSFYSEPGTLRPDGLAKFDEFLRIAEETGLYVHPTGPDHWEGPPGWQPVAIEDEKTIEALESFWKLFAARYAGRHVIFAYDLKNEPELAWESETLKTKWNAWLAREYSSGEVLAHAWGQSQSLEFGKIPVPPEKDGLKSRRLLDYQLFREGVADEWTRRQVNAIKSVDRQALVTVGLIQWSVPSLLPGSVRYYSAFRPERQAKFLDFLEIHFYPFANGAYEYGGVTEETANLSYLQSVVREAARPGKPVVLAEFGWYGGGKPHFDNGKHPFATEEQQARYCRRVIEVSSSYVNGWLNWGFYDQPEAGDCSEFTGLVTASGKIKAWGRIFSALAAKPPRPLIKNQSQAAGPALDWDACLTSTEAAKEFRQTYLESFSRSAQGASRF